MSIDDGEEAILDLMDGLIPDGNRLLVRGSDVLNFVPHLGEPPFELPAVVVVALYDQNSSPRHALKSNPSRLRHAR